MSTIRVNAIQSTSTTDGGISIDSSGHVTLDGQKLPSAGPLSNRNLVINGAMQVAQRGTSSTSNGYATLDRWKDASYGGGITQSQQALSSGDPYNEGFRNFYRLTNTTGTTGAGDTREINTNLEAQDIANSGWQYTSSTSYLTLSFWVRASVTQTYYGTLRTNDSAVYDYGFSFALTADTWTKVTKTIPGNSNLVFNDDNGQGLKVALVPFYGTNYTDSGYTLDTWAATSAGSQLPDFTTTWASTNGATFDFTGVQLEVGSVATPFEHRSYADELRRCLRYTYVLGAGNVTDNYERFHLGWAHSTTQSRFFIYHPVTMRTAPTVSTPAASAFQASDTVSAYILSALSRMASTNGPTMTAIDTTHATGATAYRPYVLERANSTNGRITFSAEL